MCTLSLKSIKQNIKKVSLLWVSKVLTEARSPFVANIGCACVTVMTMNDIKRADRYNSHISMFIIHKLLLCWSQWLLFVSEWRQEKDGKLDKNCGVIQIWTLTSDPLAHSVDSGPGEKKQLCLF